MRVTRRRGGSDDSTTIVSALCLECSRQDGPVGVAGRISTWVTSLRHVGNCAASVIVVHTLVRRSGDAERACRDVIARQERAHDDDEGDDRGDGAEGDERPFHSDSGDSMIPESRNTPGTAWGLLRHSATDG